MHCWNLTNALLPNVRYFNLINFLQKETAVKSFKRTALSQEQLRIISQSFQHALSSLSNTAILATLDNFPLLVCRNFLLIFFLGQVTVRYKLRGGHVSSLPLLA
jgi:hypothetical protein